MPAASNSKWRDPSSDQLSKFSNHKLIETVNILQGDLLQSKAETKQLSDQLSCLISLVKRSWMGDKVASYHVANIIGVPVSNEVQMCSFPFVDAQTRAIMNWERLSTQLLENEHKMIEEEIKERQKHYMNYREMYMDEILSSHQEQMSQLSLHKNSISNIQDDECKVLKNTKSKSRPPTGKGITKSASIIKNPGKVAEEIVDKVDINVQHLLFSNGENSIASTQSHSTVSSQNTDSKSSTSVKGQYDDSERYAKANLFNTNDVLGTEAFQRKRRPISASELREKDKLRSRPKSAITSKVTHKNERPLKYETTTPISQDRRGSLQHGDRRSSYDDGREAVFMTQMKAKAELQARIKSATQRPKTIDSYASDEKTRNEMESEFKQTTLSLQRKLGISKGLVY